MKAALCIIDLQNGFLKDRSTYPVLFDALEYINETASIFNGCSLPVFTVQDEDAKEERGADSFELIEEFTSEIPHDHRIIKKYGNSFWETDLEDRLKSQNVDFLVLSGFAAEACINFTYNGALERGFHAVLLRKTILSYKESYVRMVLETANNISFSTLRFLLEQDFPNDGKT